VSAVTDSADPTPVTAALDLRLVDAGLDASVRDGLAAVEERLADAVRQSDRLADDASRHLVLAGGKRMRPMLTLLAAHLGDPARPEVVEAAVVVELTHLATLYHDDVMDSAPVRRGAPAVHQVWGNTVAILTGDLLVAASRRRRSSGSASDSSTRPSGRRRRRTPSPTTSRCWRTRPAR
jgi:heptaprenyl diphosphate synthase